MVAIAERALGHHPPPLVPGLPLLGHTLTMLGNPLPRFVRYYREYGSIFRLRFGPQEWVVMAGGEAMREANRLGHEHLVAKPINLGFAQSAGSDQFILAHDGPDHAHVRRMLKPMFARDFLMARLPRVVAATRDVVRSWPKEKPFDVVWALKDLVTRQLSITLTGTDPEGLITDLQRIVTNLVMVEQIQMYPRIMLSMPSHKLAYARVRKLCDRIIREHRARTPAPEEADLVDTLLSATRPDGKPHDDNDLFVHTLGGLLAGLDTVAVTCAFALYALHKHREHLDVVLTEVDDAFARAQDGVPDVRKMPELAAVVLETMRRYPVLLGIARQVAAPFSFRGYTMRTGQRVIIGSAVAHFLSEYYPEPERFDPSRMKAPRNEHKKPFAFGSFGVGPHTCLGASMGELQLLITVATLLRFARYELWPLDYDLKVRMQTVLRPEAGFRMRVFRR